MNPGGKGANQAVAVARLGGNAVLITKIGNDIFGKQSMQLFEEEGIDIEGVVADANHPTGVALITVDEHGENSIDVTILSICCIRDGSGELCLSFCGENDALFSGCGFFHWNFTE